MLRLGLWYCAKQLALGSNVGVLGGEYKCKVRLAHRLRLDNKYIVKIMADEASGFNKPNSNWLSQPQI